VILALSSNYLTGEGEKTLDADMRSWFAAKNQEFARSGKRALAVAMRTVPANLLGNECELENAAEGDSNLAIENHLHYRHEIESIEQNLTLIGLVAMSDELKAGVKEAVEICKRAGIRLVMLTGDQAATAETIAREISILPPDSAAGLVVSGAKLEKLNPEELSHTIGQACVLARVKPEMKLSIVCNLQANGNVVAMTGDGVNDAAALRQADIGVAMGRAGTALAREASDMVITDDDITTIVKAIELGRGIYENIACAISYLLTASLASVVAVALGVLVWANLCMNPLQLLWLNLIMHVFPGLGIVLQQTPEGIMLRRPRDSKEPLLSRYKIIQIVGRALIVAACAVYAAHIMEHLNADAADTVVLDTLSLALLLQSWSWLSVGRRINFSIVDCLKNWPMWLSTTIGVGLIAVVTYFPPLALVMKTEALNQQELSLVIGGALVSFVLSAFVGLVPDRHIRPEPANQ
jgi:Ca2+-transporting ATPase